MRRGLILIPLFLLLYFLRGFLQEVIFKVSESSFLKPLKSISQRKYSRDKYVTYSEEIKYLSLKNLKIENANLKKLLGLKQQLPQSISAQVVGRISDEISDQLIINAGRKKGVKKYAAVLTPSGLVGIVDSVEDKFSKVLLYCDPRFNVLARVLSTREMGLLKGRGKNRDMQLLYLNVNTEAKVGDSVITSGEGLLPKGLFLGRIVDISIQPSQLYKIAAVKPFVDLNKVEAVLIRSKE